MTKDDPSAGTIYQLKVTLMDISPPIWRRIQVKGAITLLKLHNVLQVVMAGWLDYHLHQFEIDGIGYTRPLPGDPIPNELGQEDERWRRLNQMVTSENERFLYEYDFGDSWMHEILVEKILPLDPEMRYPVCLKGKRACPPEDVGGSWSYADFLEIIRDPDHPEHEGSLIWAGEDFDPEAFDLDEVNRALRKMR